MSSHSKDFFPCSQGIRGVDGMPGQKGEKGSEGAAGRNGLPGIQGVKGDPGSEGQEGLTGPKGEKGYYIIFWSCDNIEGTYNKFSFRCCRQRWCRWGPRASGGQGSPRGAGQSRAEWKWAERDHHPPQLQQLSATLS